MGTNESRLNVSPVVYRHAEGGTREEHKRERERV
jgi:hypothetical protein